MMMKTYRIADLGTFDDTCGLVKKAECSDGHFRAGQDGVRAVYATGDGKVELICFDDSTLCYVLSAMGYPAYYRLKPVSVQKPIKAVLMDLDGTSVRSEEFWVWIIERSVASLLGNPAFRLQKEDLPYVSGHSVSEHLQYCIAEENPTTVISPMIPEEKPRHRFGIARNWVVRFLKAEKEGLPTGVTAV